MGEIVRDLIPELIGVGAHAARTCDRESVSQAALHDNREISLATQPPRAADQFGPPPSVLPPSRRRAVPVAAGVQWLFAPVRQVTSDQPVGLAVGVVALE